MNWQGSRVRADATHHERDGQPMYAQRFDDVLSFHPPGVAAVRLGNEAWHITPDGTPTYATRFLRTFGYYDGLAAVVTADGWHHVRLDGTPLYADRYAWCGNFQSGLCTVRDQDGAYFHIDTLGNAVYTALWRYAGDFRDGIAVVQREDGRSSHVNERGELLHGAWFLDLDVFHKGLARAHDERGWMHIGRHGEPVYDRRFAAVEPFYNGQARVERFDGGLEVVGEDGDALVELRSARTSAFHELSSDLVGYWRTQVIGTAVELGVVDALPASAEQLAAALGLNCQRTERLLRGLAELSITSNIADNWTLTEKGAYLRRDHPLTFADAALEYAGPLGARWSSLPTALRAKEAWRPTDVFAEVAETGRVARHHRMLQSYAQFDYAALPNALSLRPRAHLIDAGGGTGAAARMVIEAYPSVVVTVLDRQEVVAELSPQLNEYPHVKAIAGDLFSPWPVQADAVLLARILHDWDDDLALTILRHAREALPTGGQLFVVELVLPDAGVAGALCDLHLLATTGGRERTRAQFTTLFQQAGFSLRDVVQLGTVPSLLIGVAQ